MSRIPRSRGSTSKSGVGYVSRAGRRLQLAAYLGVVLLVAAAIGVGVAIWVTSRNWHSAIAWEIGILLVAIGGSTLVLVLAAGASSFATLRRDRSRTGSRPGSSK